MVSRRLSVPSNTPPPLLRGSMGSLRSLGSMGSQVSIIPPTPSQSTQSSAPNSQLYAQANVLAQMTFELNIRAVSAQADRLEQDLKELVLRTAQDREFREKNEGRINEMWHEILVVKTMMANVDSGQERCKVDRESYQKQIAKLSAQFETETTSLKTVIKGVITQLDQMRASKDSTQNSTQSSIQDSLRNSIQDPMPSSAHTSIQNQMNSLTQYSRHGSIWNSRHDSIQPCTEPKPPERVGVETRAMKRDRRLQEAKKLEGKGGTRDRAEAPSSTAEPIQKRIHDAISSTRRWNRDHKTTALDDGAFVANYLKQQSKRDPRMAVFIQKSIRRRKGRRQPPGTAPPKSLEAFCRDVRWQDVIETVESVLIRNEASAVQALR